MLHGSPTTTRLYGLSEVIIQRACRYAISARIRLQAQRCWLYVASAAVLCGLHTGITFRVDVPGCGRGYLGPGGLADDGKYPMCTGGVAGCAKAWIQFPVRGEMFTAFVISWHPSPCSYLDRSILGRHIYQTPTCVSLYDCKPFDPEGLLGTLNSMALAIFGAGVAQHVSRYVGL
jgi:heparan-alpha-glucosaminide N-acetyltransferase